MRSTIFTTIDEHWYVDYGRPINANHDLYAVTMEFNMGNAVIDHHDHEFLAVSVVNPDSGLHKALWDIRDYDGKEAHERDVVMAFAAFLKSKYNLPVTAKMINEFM